MVAAAGLGAGQCGSGDGACRHGERDVLDVGAGHHRARHGASEFIDEQIETVRVPDYRSPARHCLL